MKTSLEIKNVAKSFDSDNGQAIQAVAPTSLRVEEGEIKLSNAGLGFLAIEYYNTFNIARMYSILIIIFIMALSINATMSYMSPRFDRA